MFKNKRTINLLKSDLNSIKIPKKEKVLPEQAFLQKRNETGRKILRIFPLKAALVSLLLIVLCTGLYLPLKYSAPPVVDNNLTYSNITSINSSDTTSSGVVEEPKLVISADVYDEYTDMDGCVPKSSEIYISDALKAKIEEYKVQDVLFRVIVDLPITIEDYEEYENSSYYNYISPEDEKAITLLEEQVKELNVILHELDLKFEANLIPKDELNEVRYKIDELYQEISDIENKSRRNYFDQLRNEKLDFAKNLGAVLVDPVYSDSEIRRSYFGNTNALVMNLSESMITEMAARGGFAFKLAPPDRAEGYDSKISDSLTTLLEQAQENEEFHVAVVSVLDKSNQFAYFRVASYNPEYNSELNKEWQGELTNESVKEFIDNILIRNNITEKRVTDGIYHDFEILNLGYEDAYIGSAGFEATLTKEQLLALAADSDVKVIYPMNTSVTDDYVNGDA